jgi:predicted MFS family arabinose efflux permease
MLFMSSRLVLLVVGFLVLFVGGGARFAIGLTLKPITEEFAIGRAVLGLTVAAYLVVTSASMFLAGRLADRFSTRAVLGWGLVTGAAGMSLMCLMTVPWQLFVLYGVVFAVGNGVASITPVALMVSRAFPERAGLANGVVSAGMSAGQLVIIALFTFILASYGWRYVFVWGGLAQLALLPLVMAGVPAGAGAGSVPADGGRPAADAGMTLADAARTRQFWLLICVYALCGLDDFFVATHIVAFAQDRGVDTILAGHLLAAMGLAGFIGVIVSGGWSDAAGPMWPALASFLARIAAFAFVMVDQSPLSIAIFALVFGFTFLMTAPLLVIFAREAFGNAHLGAITGLIIMIHHMCGGLGAWIGAAIFDVRGGYDAAFAVMLASSILASVLTVGLARR